MVTETGGGTIEALWNREQTQIHIWGCNIACSSRTFSENVATGNIPSETKSSRNEELRFNPESITFLTGSRFYDLKGCTAVYSETGVHPELVRYYANKFGKEIGAKKILGRWYFVGEVTIPKFKTLGIPAYEGRMPEKLPYDIDENRDFVSCPGPEQYDAKGNRLRLPPMDIPRSRCDEKQRGKFPECKSCLIKRAVE